MFALTAVTSLVSIIEEVLCLLECFWRSLTLTQDLALTAFRRRLEKGKQDGNKTRLL
jgi:hypothetical protein